MLAICCESLQLNGVRFTPKFREHTDANKTCGRLVESLGLVDNASVRDVSSKTGHDFRQLLQLTNTKFDCISFDFSGEGPALRLNMFHPISDAGGE